MASKQTMKNQLNEMAKQLLPQPYQVEGFVFEEDLGEDHAGIDHRVNQKRLGFLKSAKESEAYHKAHSNAEFVYLGNDYLEFITEHPDEAK